VITDDDELLEMLAAPLDKWRVFLHPSQRRLVNNDWNGPVRVLGGAGTGKTVVAMHRAKWLVEKCFTDTKDRILFTTFTRNLAVDIEANLRKICSAELMRRIKVENLDSWVTAFLKAEGVPIRVAYGDELDDLWQQAFSLGTAYPDNFYKDEWKQVIQPQNITNPQDYFKASRVGRGTRLNRMQRAAAWPVFEEFRALMKQKGLKDREDAMYDACSLLQRKPDSERPYRSIIVDEAQDMGPADFTLIRNLVSTSGRTNDIFIVGDPHQRIYGRQVILSRCGIEVRGRSRKLRINYRTTDETRKWATALLVGLPMDDLDGGSDDLTDYRSLMHGAEPWIQGFPCIEDEIGFIHKELQKLEYAQIPLSSICVVVRTNNLAKNYSANLKQLGIESRSISRSEADNPALPGVRVATMHRVKGLQFEYVFLAGLNRDHLPPQAALSKTADQTARNMILKTERCLLHVSATRAKQGVFVTYHGQPSELLPINLRSTS
jgi:superfamily I DNA/RNA helicase